MERRRAEDDDNPVRSNNCETKTGTSLANALQLTMRLAFKGLVGGPAESGRGVLSPPPSPPCAAPFSDRGARPACALPDPAPSSAEAGISRGVVVCTTSSAIARLRLFFFLRRRSRRLCRRRRSAVIVFGASDGFMDLKRGTEGGQWQGGTGKGGGGGEHHTNHGLITQGTRQNGKLERGSAGLCKCEGAAKGLHECKCEGAVKGLHVCKCEGAVKGLHV
jgi:hypothetical protein